MASSGTRVLVVGAGIVGRSVAYFLSRRDIEVVLLDSTKTPSPTTRASLGVLTRFNGGTSSYARLFRDGCALHARLAADLAVEMGVDVGWRPLGSIELYLNPSDEWRLEELLASSRERGCPVDRLDGRALREMEPALATEVWGGLYFPGDNRVDPSKLGAALWASAARRGAVALCGDRVVQIAQRGEGVEIVTEQGNHCADFAVLAAGAWSGELAGQLGAQVTVRPVRGQHARFAGCPLQHLVHVDGHYMVPDGDETLVGATVEEVGFDLRTTAAAVVDLSARVEEVLGGVLPFLSHRAGLRPKPKNGRPLIGPLQASPRFFVASGHYKNGVLLGPITGQIIARWIAEGVPGRDMSRFTPER